MKDDAYIDTDIDAIIKYLRVHKRANLNDLSRDLNVDKATLKKWLKVLEQGKYVKLNYSLFKEEVIWLGDDFITDEDIENDKEGFSLEIEPLKPLDLSSDKAQVIEDKDAELIEEMENISSQDLDKLIDEYLQELKNKRLDLRSLELEKERLYNELYLPLEESFKSEFETFYEKILENEKKLLYLKEKALSLPEKIKEALTLEESLLKLKEKIKQFSLENKSKINKLREILTERDKEIKDEMNKLYQEIAEKKEEVNSFASVLNEIENYESELGAQIEQIKEKINSLNEKLSFLEEKYAGISDVKSEYNSKLDALSSFLEEKEKKLDEMKEQLYTVKEVEELIAKCVEDYDNKLKDLDEYIGSAQKEVNSLIKASKIKSINNYVDRLVSLSDDYSKKIEELEAKEKTINEKIEQSKKDIKLLADKVKELINKYKSKDSNIEELFKKAKEHRERLKAVLTSPIDDKLVKKPKKKDKTKKTKQTKKRQKRKKRSKKKNKK